MREKLTSEDRARNVWLRRYAKRLRTSQTDAEWAFWYQVRAHRLAGFKFKRQYPIGSYIADFVCLECKLIVELDGNQHLAQRKYDQERDAFLRSKGFRVLRIWNVDMLTNRDGVMEVVFEALRSTTAPSP